MKTLILTEGEIVKKRRNNFFHFIYNDTVFCVLGQSKRRVFVHCSSCCCFEKKVKRKSVRTTTAQKAPRDFRFLTLAGPKKIFAGLTCSFFPLISLFRSRKQKQASRSLFAVDGPSHHQRLGLKSGDGRTAGSLKKKRTRKNLSPISFAFVFFASFKKIESRSELSEPSFSTSPARLFFIRNGG